jgi:hypothetical protein
VRIVLGLFIVAGAVVVAITQKQDEKNIAENGVLLPERLIQKPSASRRDLALLDRSLYELAIEADRNLSRTPGPQNRKRETRYLDRLERLRATGRDLEPNLTHEESRVLAATDHAENAMEAFIKSSLDETTFDRELIKTAEKQIKRAQALARGQSLDGEAVPEGLGMLGSVGSNLSRELKTIESSRGQERASVKAILDGPEWKTK